LVILRIRATEQWIPAFAGMTTGRNLLSCVFAAAPAELQSAKKERSFVEMALPHASSD